MKTLPVLPHPLPPQKQEEFGLAVYTAVVPGAHRAAFTDGVRSIARCRTNTGEETAEVISRMELNTWRCQRASTQVLVGYTHTHTHTFLIRSGAHRQQFLQLSETENPTSAPA